MRDIYFSTLYYITLNGIDISYITEE